GETDIGAPSIAGSSSVNNGTYTVSGSGFDIWANADQFHYVYKPWTGDGTIIARVVSVPNTNTAAKAGVMFRETLAAGSKHAAVTISPDNQARFLRRTTTNGTSAVTFAANSAAPYFVKLVRSGSTFTAYRSLTGVSW